MRFFLPLALLLFLVSIPGASYAALNTQPASAAAEQTNEAPEPLLNQDGPLIAPENNIPLAEPLAPAAPAPAVSSAVVVRVGRHPEFIRFSFDWPENVDYTVKVSDTKVILQFSKAGDLNSQPFSKILGDGISDVAAYKEDGKLKVVFTLIKPAQGRWFKDGKTVALDILAPQASAEKPPAKAPEVKAEPPKPEPEPAKAEAPPPEAPEVKAQPKSASPYPPEKAAPREAVDGQQLQHDAPRELVNKPAVPLSLQRGEKTVSLKFSWDKLPGAAVFQRAGYVWIVFDQDADFVLDAVAQNVAKVLGKVETISLNGGVALRLQSIPGLELALGNDPKNFEIIMRKKGGVPNVALKIDTLTDENGRPYLYLSAGVEVKRLFTITDPEVGDQFLVAPLSKYGLGVNGLREYASFRLLPTIQGIVMQSFSDQVAMMPQALGVEIASKQGLAITPPPSAEAPEKMASEEEYGPPIPTAAEMDRPVLDFAGWQRGRPSSFLSIERQLWQKIVSLPLKERSAARFDLATFYFSHGWMSEALSILKTIVQEDEAFTRDLNFIAIYGVASLLNGDVKTADDYLKDPRFDDKRDIIMWRAVVAAEQRDYLAAAEQFKRAGEENPAIPSDLRRAILRLKLNALIESEDFDGLEQAIVAYQKSPDASLFRNEWQYWK
ncbi:MAG: tetratricopeptide repeat protein, partial [Dongiaceae bacterium]